MTPSTTLHRAKRKREPGFPSGSRLRFSCRAALLRLIVLGSLFMGASPAVFAQARTATGNPLQTLPRVAPPAEVKSTATVEPANPPEMAALLSRVITPSNIRIEGVKSIPFKAVSARFTPFIGKPVTLQVLIEAANAVTKDYQTQGYALSFAFIPSQDFAQGVVRVVAVEGFVSNVAITGEPGNITGRIRAIAQHIADEKPLRRATFERYIALLGQLPGIKVAADVAPPTRTDGATQLNLKVTRQRFSVSSGLSSNQPGFQGVLTVSENSLLSLGEQLSLSALAPRGPNGVSYYAATYSEPLGSNGLTLKADASRYRGEPDSTQGLPSSIKRSVRQDRVGVGLAYPVILENSRSLSVSANAYGVTNDDRYTNQDSGAFVGLRSQSRVLQAQVDWTDVTAKETRRANVVVAKGLDILGASKEGYASISNVAVTNPVDLNFVRVGSTVSDTRTLIWGFSTTVSATGQYSGQSLPTSEQITFGGQRYALGYEPGSAAGDSGWGTSVEVNRAFVFGFTYLKALTPYVSYALARTYLSKSMAPPARLASVAAGMRVSDSRFYSLDISVGLPIGDRPVENTSRSPRINASFSYQLD